MTSNLAAWSPSPKGDLEIKEAPMYTVQGDEILIKVSIHPISCFKLTKFRLQNEAIAIQPFDAEIRRNAYISSIKYPFILGGTVAGTIVEIGPDVTHFKVGDRVVSDTPVYKKRETRFGGWQKFVVGKAGLSAKVRFEFLFQSVRD